MPPVDPATCIAWSDPMCGFNREAPNEEDWRTRARNSNQQRHDPAQVRRDDRGCRRDAARRAVPRRQGSRLCAGAQAALPAMEQLRPRRRRRDQTTGRGVQEGNRGRHHGRDDQPERHGGADHRRGRERQRGRRDPDERQPTASVRQRSRRPQRSRAGVARRPGVRVGERRRDGRWRRPGRASVQHRQRHRLPQGRVRGAGPQDAQHVARVSRGRQSLEEQQSAGRPDARSHLRRRADVRLSVAVELRWPGSRRGRQDRGDRFPGHP